MSQDYSPHQFILFEFFQKVRVGVVAFSLAIKESVSIEKGAQYPNH